MKTNLKVSIYLAVSSSTISICNGDRQVAEEKENKISYSNE
jgi:hypothetical protein